MGTIRAVLILSAVLAHSAIAQASSMAQATSLARPTWSTSADLRYCLDRKSNEAIIRCAEGRE